MDKQDGKVYDVDFKRKERNNMEAATANSPVTVHDLHEEYYSLDARARRAIAEKSDTSDVIDNQSIEVGDFICFTDEQIRDDERFMQSRRYSRHQGVGNAEQHTND